MLAERRDIELERRREGRQRSNEVALARSPIQFLSRPAGTGAAGPVPNAPRRLQQRARLSGDHLFLDMLLEGGERGVGHVGGGDLAGRADAGEPRQAVPCRAWPCSRSRALAQFSQN